MKKIFKIISLGFLIGQLICAGCVSGPTIKQAGYINLRQFQPENSKKLQELEQESPKDSIFIKLLQAFALMRTGNITQKITRDQIRNLLEESVSSFEDLSDPENFSVAFSADESKDFRGRPHERVMTALLAGVFHMGEGNYDRALPYLRNAEFLDARMQKMPFGTDAPLVYALMYKALKNQQSDQESLDRAKAGIFNSLRFLSYQDILIQALVELSKTDIRPMAISNKIAYMLYEISIYYSLMVSKQEDSISKILDNATKNANLFIAELSERFGSEYKAKLGPVIKEQAKLLGLDKTKGLEFLEELAMQRVGLDLDIIGSRLKKIFISHEKYKNNINNKIKLTQKRYAQIMNSLEQESMTISFTGVGPKLDREGSYQEISVVKPGPDADMSPDIRVKNLKINKSCGFHRLPDGGFSVVLCDKKLTNNNLNNNIYKTANLELLSLSRKATNIQGRDFDKVLRGRAQFRAATENIGEIGAWSALFLFYMGAAVMSSCSQKKQSSSTCYSAGLALWAIGAATFAVTGVIWLVGKSSNPAADSRYITSMYESGWLKI